MKMLFLVGLGSAAFWLAGCVDKSEVVTTEPASALGETTPKTDATGIPPAAGPTPGPNSGSPQGGLPPGR